MITQNDSQYIDQGDKLFGDYIAEVVDNKDPNNIGRVKIFIEGMDVSRDPGLLRWAIRMDPVDFGTSDNLSSFSVPVIGSKVVVSFIGGDPQKPIYKGRLYTSQKVDESQNENMYISKDPISNSVKSDMVNKTINVDLVSDVTVNLKGANKGLSLVISKDLDIAISKNLDIQAQKTTIDSNDKINIISSSDINITSSGIVNVKGLIINLN